MWTSRLNSRLRAWGSMRKVWVPRDQSGCPRGGRVEVWGGGSGDDQGDEDRDREGGSSREGELLRVVWWKEWGVMVIPEDLWTIMVVGGAGWAGLQR